MNKYTLPEDVEIKEFIRGLPTTEIKAFMELVNRSEAGVEDIPDKLKWFLVEAGIIVFDEDKYKFVLTEKAKTYQYYDIGLLHDLQDLIYERTEKQTHQRIRNEHLGI